jgi:hypothetical protein
MKRKEKSSRAASGYDLSVSAWGVACRVSQLPICSLLSNPKLFSEHIFPSPYVCKSLSINFFDIISFYNMAEIPEAQPSEQAIEFNVPKARKSFVPLGRCRDLVLYLD